MFRTRDVTAYESMRLIAPYMLLLFSHPKNQFMIQGDYFLCCDAQHDRFGGAEPKPHLNAFVRSSGATSHIMYVCVCLCMHRRTRCRPAAPVHRVLSDFGRAIDKSQENRKWAVAARLRYRRGFHKLIKSRNVFVAHFSVCFGFLWGGPWASRLSYLDWAFFYIEQIIKSMAFNDSLLRSTLLMILIWK